MNSFRKKIRILFNLYSYIRYYLSFRDLKKSIANLSQFLPIDRVIVVDVAAITHYLASEIDGSPLVGRDLFRRRFIKSGDWDLCKKKIFPDFYNENMKFRSVFQVFRDGVPVEECDSLKNCTDSYKRARLLRKFNRYKAMYSNFVSGGYKTQEELGRKKRFRHFMEIDEIKVVIDRDGQFLKVEESGKHRLALAMIANVKKIPVFVVGVHEDYALNAYKKHGEHLLDAINKEFSLIR